MTTFVVAPLFGALANLGVAVAVFLLGPKQRLYQVYLGWGLALSLWCAGASALFLVSTEHMALLWAHLLHFGVIWIPVTGLHVCMLVAGSEQHRRLKYLLRACYAVTVGLTIANVTGVYVDGVTRLEYGWFAKAGVGFWIFSGFMPVATVPAILTLFFRRRRAEADQRRKYTILIAANTLLLVAGTHDLAPVLGMTHYPGTNITVFPWGTYAAGLYGLMVAYGVLQDQILNVRVTLSRYAAYVVRIGFFCSVALLLLIVAGIVAPRGALTSYAFGSCLLVIIVSAVLTAWLFPKLFGVVGEGWERRILGDRFEYQEQLAALSDSLHRFTTLAAMWSEIAVVLNGSMRLTPVHCLILGLRRFSTPVRYTEPAGHPSAKVSLERLGPDSPLLQMLESCGGHFDVGGADREGKPFLEAARKQATEMGAEYVFPLRGAGRIIGLIAVGPKADGRPMTTFDMELLERLAQRVAWATERTLLAEQLAFADRHELLALMSRGLAHDLNNLLTPVSTILQICGRSIAAGSIEEQLLNAAGTSLRHVRNYVEEAIFFAKDLRPRMTEVTIEEMLRDSVAVVESKAQRHGVTLRSRGTAATITVDLVLCQRILANLLSNAVDASRAGQNVEIEGIIEEATDVVRFTVQDSGVGIPPENLSRIWQPYFTTKDASDADERGFGLGLAVCQLLVELHQGAIRIQSTVGVGTKAIVELPRQGAGQPPWVPPHYVS